MDDVNDETGLWLVGIDVVLFLYIMSVVMSDAFRTFFHCSSLLVVSHSDISRSFDQKKRSSFSSKLRLASVLCYIRWFLKLKRTLSCQDCQACSFLIWHKKIHFFFYFLSFVFIAPGSILKRCNGCVERQRLLFDVINRATFYLQLLVSSGSSRCLSTEWDSAKT